MPVRAISGEARTRLQFALVLALAGGLGWTSAYAVDQSLGGLLEPPEAVATVALSDPVDAPEVARPAPSRPRPPGRTELVRPIVERSIFDSSKVGGPDRGEEVGEGEVLADLDLILLATVVARPAEHSSALIGEPGTRRSRKGKRGRKVSSRGVENSQGYGIGDEVPGGATIVAIEQGKVTLEQGGRKAVLLIGDPRDEAEERPGKAAPKGGGAGEDGVEKLGSDRYAIDREVIDELSANPSKLSRLGRVRPHESDGQVDGYRLSGLRRKTLGRSLGLRNGDVVHSVNGHDLTSMSAAMSAYSALADSRELEVRITRRGKERTLTYEIR